MIQLFPLFDHARSERTSETRVFVFNYHLALFAPNVRLNSPLYDPIGPLPLADCSDSPRNENGIFPLLIFQVSFLDKTTSCPSIVYLTPPPFHLTWLFSLRGNVLFFFLFRLDSCFSTFHYRTDVSLPSLACHLHPHKLEDSLPILVQSLPALCYWMCL